MSKNNRIVDLVFSDIVGTEDRPNAGDKFLAVDKALGIHPGLELFQYKEIYREALNRIKLDLQTLADLEEKIVQNRCLLRVGADIKLSLVREYIYARALFYRKGMDAKDIRVLIGTSKTYGTDLEKLYQLPEFMELAEYKLGQAMKEELKHDSFLIEHIKAVSLK